MNKTLELMFGPDRGMKGSPWATPRASDGEKGGPNQSFSAGGQPLPAQMHQASPWATPSVVDSTNRGYQRSGGKTFLALPGQMDERLSGPITSGSPATTARRGAPNPTFPCWLMGYGVAWLLATPSDKPQPRFHKKARRT